MLEKIKISNAASYDNPGVQITDLKKVNFFYGANGCGKTTLSNYLKSPQNEKFTQCSSKWSGGRTLKALVYNKQFREENFSAESGDIAGVFTLGQATQQDIDNINKKKEDKRNSVELRTNTNISLETIQRQLAAREKSFIEDECWPVYKQYEADFKEALRGSIGSKPAFKDKIVLEEAINTSELLTLDELKYKASTLLGERPARMDRIPSFTFEQLTNIENQEIWKKVIVGKEDVDVAGLIGRLGNSDWIDQGRKYIDNKTCPFCQKQTIDDLFKQKIEEYFDESYEQEKFTLSELQRTYLELNNQILSALEQIEITEKSNNGTKLNIDIFSAYLKAIHGLSSENNTQIQIKLDKTSQQIQLTDTSETLNLLSGLIDEANAAIDVHNLLVTNYDQEVTNLKSATWRFLVAQLNAKITAYQTITSGLQRGITNLNGQIQTHTSQINSLESEIVELGKNVTSVQPTVDEVNRTLKSYGFTNFEIVPSPAQANHYVIKRGNGDLAHQTLSEGEVTFITFLYFVQLAKGAIDKNEVTEDRILVIDDPISSLDSNVLYVVSTIIKSLIKQLKDEEGNIHQILLFTHNVYFHKEVSFQNGRSNGDKDTHFWILRKNNNVTSVQAYQQDNPIESSYELLWREVKEWQRNSGVTLQNTMRRIIENYFKILGKFGDDDLVESFDSFEEQQICRSLLCWINDGSHTIPDDLFIQTQEDSSEKFLGVFEKIFVETNNHGHYQMMMGETTE